MIFVAGLLVVNSGFSQNGFFLTGALELAGTGEPYYSFQENNSVLTKNWLGTKAHDDTDILHNLEINLNYHFLDHFGISFNLGLRDKAVVVHDKRFMISNDITGSDYSGNYGAFRVGSGNFNPNRLYLSPGFSGSYFFNGKDISDKASGPFLGYGIQVNKYLASDKAPTGIYFHENTSELLEFKTSFKSWYFSQYVEAGFLFFPNYLVGSRIDGGPKKTTRGFVGSLSVRYTFAGTYMTADYQVSKNGITEYTDHFTAGGSGISVVLKLGGSVLGYSLDKKNKERYEHARLKEDLRKAFDDSIAASTHFDERKLSVKEEIIVENKVVTISVWDHLKYDRDIISLGLNDELVLENYTLQTSKKTVQVDLDKSDNLFILYAVSEGEEKPCTVAILIDDGISQRQVILNSSIAQSEGIRIKVRDKD